MHESTLHEENSFLTLTYNPESLPAGGTLKKSDFQDFMKRYRKGISPGLIRFFHCGEYGEECKNCHKNRHDCQCQKFEQTLGRPHYHALIFGHDFADKALWKIVRGNRLYTSETLDRYWGKGFCSIGAVTFQSAAYVARYIVKKIGGKQAKEHYKNVDVHTGEISQKLPEYITMSRRPGIAAGWFSKFATDVFPDDFCTIEGKKYKTPRYYDKLLERITPEYYLHAIKAARSVEAARRAADNTPERLAVREEVQELKNRRFERNVDS